VRTYTLDSELVTSAGLEEAFLFFEDPYNLARITPPWLGFRIVTENLKMRQGLEIDYEFRWLGLPLRWKTVITEYDPPFSFVDEAVQSPYALWRHRHSFYRTEGGTVVADRVDWALPLDPFSRPVAALIVARQLRAIFSYRQNAIRQILG
jgi:ligand-binding SRPBCC domain-containing protein